MCYIDRPQKFKVVKRAVLYLYRIQLDRLRSVKSGCRAAELQLVVCVRRHNTD